MANWASSPSSSTPATGSSSYDVFLNFRGEDTCNNFTAFLYLFMKSKGIHVFMDDEKLPTGEAIGLTLFRAIEGSKISIPILSERYAESKWCLRELVRIVQCHRTNGQIVLPILYHIDPSHVRHQTGSFEEAFREHETKFKPDIIKSWREALSVVGALKGEVIDENMNQAKLVESLVQRVLGELVSSTHLAECKYSIGMESRVHDVLQLLNVGSENVQFVGICGFGGVGKTTIAKAVYNHILPKFGRHCFLSDVRGHAAQWMGLVSLQKQLLKDIFKEDFDITNCHSGKEFIRQRLCKEKVLVVLDDVEKQEQVDALASELNWFGQGSRIILTTRDEDILNLAKVDQNKIYKPQELSFEQSLQLFSLHAFSSDQPPEDYMQLSHHLAHYSGGLPLTLEVIGSYLSNRRSKEVWESTLQKLKEIPNTDVQRKLRISYDNLEDHHQKAIFLDAECFFIGWEKETVISFWEACGYYPKSGIDRLIKRSLLKFEQDDDDKYYLKMHDQIRDMGREIVSEENRMEFGKRSRLWSHKDVIQVLEGHKGTDKIEGMIIPKDVPEELCLTNIHFKKMSKLRFLNLSLEYFKGEISCLPSSIRLLKCNISDCLPINFYHKGLVLLDLSNPYGNIKQVWNIKPQNENKFQTLKVLNLRSWRCLSQCPDFSWFPYLERLDLQQCGSLANLSKSIGDLNSLVEFDLGGTGIKELPDSISKLSSLNKLILSCCSSLKKLPESIGDLNSLVELDLGGTGIEELPDSISKLSSLNKLILSWCSSLKKLPESIGDLNSLVEFDLGGTRATEIEELPDSISKLSSLNKLILNWCLSLKKLPESIGDLNSLVELDLRATEIKELPDSISKLSSLNKLILSWCSSLKKLPESIGDLNSLVELDLAATEIEELPDSISKLSSLNKLILSRCLSLKKLSESIGDLNSLVELDLGVTGIEELPDSISKLSSLNKLVLSCCSSLKKLPESIGDLNSLVELYLWETGIEELPDSISKLSSLNKLLLSRCSSLKKLPESIGDLNSLVELDLAATGIEELPDSISKLSSLNKLVLSRCSSLKKLPESIGDLNSVVELNLWEIGIEELPDSISKLSSLKKLILSGCSSLKKLPESIGDLNSLVELYLWETGIEELPDSISKLSSFNELILSGCSSLKKLPESIGDLSSLVDLDLGETRIEELPDNISKLSSLKKLILSWCSSLQKLPESIGDLNSLVELNLEETGIEELPDNISKLSSLKKLILSRCSSLKKLPESIGDLNSLVELDLWETGIEELPDNISKLSSLKKLILSGCSSLKKLPESIGDLNSLVDLDLRETGIEELPDNISKLSSLKKLILSRCSSLQKLPESIGDLNSLVKLDLGETGIEELPDNISKLSSLKKLILSRCSSLQKLPESIGDLNSLVELDLGETGIEELPDNISKLSSLKKLILELPENSQRAFLD